MIDQDAIDPEGLSSFLLPVLDRADLGPAGPAEASAEMPGPGAIVSQCGICGIEVAAGERVILFLDGDLAEGGGVTDLRARGMHHYECFFPEEAGS